MKQPQAGTKAPELDEKKADDSNKGILAIVHSTSRSHSGHCINLQVHKKQWAKFTKKMARTRTGYRVHLIHLAVLTTYFRELFALYNTRKSKIARYILNPTNVTQTGDVTMFHAPQLRARFNASQNAAIEAALVSKEGFTLVQGPPGTGKTSTVVGLLNSLHLKEYQRYYDAIMDVAIQPDGRATERRWQELGAEKPHILVCAPSNIAVDNILEKIIEDGFLDANGGVYRPVVSRVGRGKGVKVKAVSIDEQVDELLNQDPQELGLALAAASQEVQTLLGCPLSQLQVTVIKMGTTLNQRQKH